jgi:anti-sigma-K factor RskA
MNGHPTREEDFDLYALGALEGDEKAAIENHVTTCSSCAEKLAEARGRLALLALAAPAVAPSPSLKARLMNQVRSEKQGAARAPVVSPVPDTAGGLLGHWWAAVLIPVGFALALASFVLWTQNRRLDSRRCRQTCSASSSNCRQLAK